MLDSYLAWLLLPLGVALGLAWARSRAAAGTDPASREESLAGLNSLDNDNADQAIVALSRAADAEPAAELQLTLGALFRKRGEIDRAIQLHEAVLARSDLPRKIADAARIELAQDYLKAGLLDRAESLLQEMEGSSPQLAGALELLLDLYEQARDWLQAIETARRLQAVKGQSLAPRIAQYVCELAEAALHRGTAAEAANALQSALECNPECVRASLIQAAMAEKGGDWAGAIKAYWRAMQQDGRFFSEVTVAMERCYSASGDKRGYGKFLDEAETSLTTSATPALTKARWLQTQGQDPRSYFGEHLARMPSRQGMLFWLEGSGSEVGAPQWLQTLRESLKKSLQARPLYACISCGLQPSMLFWQCPKCKRWETVVPLEEKL
jgi:lipopolysaccharide biosynthesis regulator YciM